MIQIAPAAVFVHAPVVLEFTQHAGGLRGRTAFKKAVPSVRGAKQPEKPGGHVNRADEYGQRLYGKRERFF
jgi:hypothetical protein